jgi:hypothetical protein
MPRLSKTKVVRRKNKTVNKKNQNKNTRKNKEKDYNRMNSVLFSRVISA